MFGKSFQSYVWIKNSVKYIIINVLTKTESKVSFYEWSCKFS